MKRILTVLMCLAALLLVSNLATHKKNAGTVAIGRQRATQMANQIAKNTAEAPRVAMAEVNQNNLTSAAEIARHKDVATLTAAGNQEAGAQQNTFAFLSVAQNRTRGATQSAGMNAAQQNAEAAQADAVVVALAEALMITSGAMQPTQNNNFQTAPAQAVVISGQGDYDVILPQSLANSTVATQSHFGKEVADAPYLAGCLAPATAHFAQWQIGTAIPGVVMVT